MRKTILALILACAAPAWASISLVSQGINATYEGGATSTTGSVITTGSSLIVIGCAGNTSAATSVTNSGTADTWFLVSSKGNSTAGYVALYYSYAPSTSSSQTFTCHWGSNQGIAIAYEYAFSGTAITSGVYDVSTASSSISSNGQIFTGSITPAIPGEVLISIAIDAPDTSQSCDGSGASNGFTDFDLYYGQGNTNADMAYLVYPASSAINVQWTFHNTSANADATIIAAFKPSGGASTPPPAHVWLLSELDEKIWRWHDARREHLAQSPPY